MVLIRWVLVMFPSLVFVEGKVTGHQAELVIAIWVWTVCSCHKVGDGLLEVIAWSGC